jgi:hypothetical protein
VARLGNLLFQVGLGEERGTHQAVWAGWHGLGDEWAVGIFEVGGFTEADGEGWIRDGTRVGGVWLVAVKSCLQRLRTPDAVINGCMIARGSVESYSFPTQSKQCRNSGFQTPRRS